MNQFTKTVLITCCFLIVVSVCQAGIIEPGIRGGYYSTGDSFYLGADVKFGLAMLYADPSIEYIFIDNGSFWTFNADAYVSLGIPVVSVWAGGGLALLYASPDNFDSQTDVGVNLIAGVEFDFVVNPYLMVKYIIAPNDDVTVIGVGLRF